MYRCDRRTGWVFFGQRREVGFLFESRVIVIYVLHLDADQARFYEIQDTDVEIKFWNEWGLMVPTCKVTVAVALRWGFPMSRAMTKNL